MLSVREQGMLFQWSPRNPPSGGKSGGGSSQPLPLLSYWVSGRLFLGPNPRECYICHHESAPQVMVEMAFRLACGVHL